MLAIKRSAGVAAEVNLRILQVMKSGMHSAFETHHKHNQKSKTGIPVAPQKGPQNF